MPATAPHTGSGNWIKAIASGVLGLAGWKVVGELPAHPKLMIIAAPHTSAWDAVWGLIAKVAIGMQVNFLAKREAFIGPLGWVLRHLGGIPINRRAAGGVINQAVQAYTKNDAIWFCIAPEGTRKPVEHWKPGFWRIARAANVPVLCIYFHYPERTIGLGPIIELSDDYAADMARIREYYRPWVGKHRGTL